MKREDLNKYIGESIRIGPPVNFFEFPKGFAIGKPEDSEWLIERNDPEGLRIKRNDGFVITMPHERIAGINATEKQKRIGLTGLCSVDDNGALSFRDFEKS